LPKYDRVLAVCTSDRKLLVNRGLSPKKVLVHLNGVDRPSVPAETRLAEQARIRKSWKLAEHGVGDDTLLIGFVGRLSPEKRLNRILQICSHLEREHRTLPDWRLVVFGTGALDQELKSMTQSLGLEQRILWMGYRSGVGDELAGFDIVISMSDAEGLPINLIEAGWGGTPVFATRVDGNLDLMPEEELGYLVDVSEADDRIASRLAELMANRSKREKMGKAFQKRVSERFSGQRWLRDLKAIYQDLEKE
jgi:glycosyltransferase involved in cell wall biosynthesis